MIDENTGKPFDTGPSAFLGGVDIYDREHTLGETLNSFDINDSNDRQLIIEEYCVGYLKNDNYKKKYLTWLSLKSALNDRQYNFSKLLEHDPDTYTCLPDDWDEIQDARAFFAEIFKTASLAWKDELGKAMLEDPESW